MVVDRRRVVLVAFGVVLLLAALAVRSVVVPRITMLPGDLSQTQHFTGTYDGLNPTALQGGSGPLTLEQAAVTADRGLTVEQVDGPVAVVRITSHLDLKGVDQAPVVNRYAVDRSDYRSVAAPSGVTGVNRSQGQIFTLPRHPDPSAGYRMWDPASAVTIPMVYRGEATVAGRPVQKYDLSSRGPVPDPAALGLPSSLSREQLTDLAPALVSAVPPAFRSRLPELLEQLPESLPVTWSAVNTSALEVDREFGAPIRSVTTQALTANVQGISFPFSTVRLTTAPSSLDGTVATLTSNARSLFLVQTLVPGALAVLGAVLLVGGLLRRRGL